MLSFTVCWVIPREWRGWKTSRFRPLAEETTHIYIFFKLFTSPIQQRGGQAACFVVPIPVPAASACQCPAPDSGETSAHNLCRLRQRGPVPTASREPSAVTNPPQGRARGSSDRSAILSSSDPLSRRPWPSPGAGGHLRSNKKWHLCPYQDTPLCEDPYRNMD